MLTSKIRKIAREQIKKGGLFVVARYDDYHIMVIMSRLIAIITPADYLKFVQPVTKRKPPPENELFQLSGNMNLTVDDWKAWVRKHSHATSQGILTPYIRRFQKNKEIHELHIIATEEGPWYCDRKFLDCFVTDHNTRVEIIDTKTKVLKFHNFNDKGGFIAYIGPTLLTPSPREAIQISAMAIEEKQKGGVANVNLRPSPMPCLS